MKDRIKILLFFNKFHFTLFQGHQNLPAIEIVYMQIEETMTIRHEMKKILI